MLNHVSLAVACTMALLPIATCSGSVVVNGSFEETALGMPSRVSLVSLSGWNAFGGSSLLERGVNGVSNIEAHTGAQFVSMGHNSASGDTLQQTLATQAGLEYTVTFFVASIQGDGEQDITATAVDSSVGTLATLVATASRRAEGWLEQTFSFEAASDATVLRFVHSRAAGQANIALDSVTVVPAPAGAAVLAASVGVACGRRRRAAV